MVGNYFRIFRVVTTMTKVPWHRHTKACNVIMHKVYIRLFYHRKYWQYLAHTKFVDIKMCYAILLFFGKMTR